MQRSTWLWPWVLSSFLLAGCGNTDLTIGLGAGSTNAGSGGRSGAGAGGTEGGTQGGAGAGASAGSGGSAGGGPIALWSHAIGENMQPQTVEAVAVDGSGAVLVTGGGWGTIELGLNATSEVSSPLGPFSEGPFVAKFHQAGSQPFGSLVWVKGMGWVKQFDGSTASAGEAIAVDASGNVLVAGHYSGTLDLGGGPMTANGRSTFVAKLDANGDTLWSRSITGAYPCVSNAARLTYDDAGNVYVATEFCGTLSDLGAEPIVSKGQSDIVVAKFAGADGKVIWAGAVGGNDIDELGGLGFDGAALYLVGDTNSNDFRSGPLSQGPGKIFTLVWPASGPPNVSTGVLSRYGDGSDGTARIAARGDNGMMMGGSFAGTLDFGGHPMTSAGQSDVYVAKLGSSGAVWSKRFGDANDQALGAIASEGTSAWFTGPLKGTMDWGCGSLTSAGGSDVFIARLDTDGQCTFGMRAGDAQDQSGWGIAANSSFAAVGGSFRGTLVLPGTSAKLTSYSDDSFGDGFVMGLKTSGATAPSPSWTARTGDALTPQDGVSVATDRDNNVLVAGNVEGFVHFPDMQSPLVSHGESDNLVVKYDDTGRRLWAKDFGGAGYDSPGGLAVDPSANVVLAGTFQKTIEFGGGPMTARSPSGSDLFVAKLDPSGKYVWQKDVPSTTSAVLAPAVDSRGNLALAGSFSSANNAPGSIDWGGGALNTKGLNDIYLAKLDAAGHHVWSKSFGFSGAVDEAQSVVFDPSGAVVLAGAFEQSIDFGGGLIRGAGGWDMFLAKFDPNGQYLWSQHFSTEFHSGEMRMQSAVDGSGNIITTGSFDGSLEFGGTPVTSQSLQSLFVAKFDPAGKLQWVHTYEEAGGTAIAADSHGNVVITGTFFGTLDFGGGHVLQASSQDPHLFVVKFDPEGRVLAAAAYSARIPGTWPRTSVASDKDGTVLLTGSFVGTLDFGSGPITSAGSGASIDLFVGKIALP